MKIAYVINSLEGGGVTLPVPAVTRVLRSAGAQVTVFALTRRDARGLPSMLADGLPVRVRAGGEHDQWSCYRWLDRELSAYQPTVIWTSLSRASVMGLLLGRRLRAPVVCWQHNETLDLFKLFLLYVLRKRVALWVADSQLVCAITAKRFAPAEDRLLAWPLFIADPTAPQAPPWQPGQTLQLGSLGRLQPNKGYDVLVSALALLRARGFSPPVPFEITIAGDGGEHDAISKAARRAQITNLKLAGFTEQPRDWLSGLHLYLQPSRREGLCIAVHEAMQAGLPVIASAVGQIPCTIEEGESGWLVPPADPSALADALAAALAEPARLAAMGIAARDRVLPLFSAEEFHRAGIAAHQRSLAAAGAA